MRCWGYNYFGQVMLLEYCLENQACVCSPFDLISLCGLSQLGNDSFTNQKTPVGVVGLSSGVSSISLGGVRLSFDLLTVQALCYESLPVFVLLAWGFS